MISSRWRMIEIKHAGTALGLLVALLFIPHPIAADDDSYLEYVKRRVSEGLESNTSESVAARMDGAHVAALYAWNLKKEGASPNFIQQASRACLTWLREEEEPWVRHLLVEVLGEMDAEYNRSDLLALLSDPDPTVRSRAAEYLPGKLSREEEDVLIRQYGRESLWWVQKEFLQALGRGESDTSLRILHEALYNPIRDVRAAASVALAERAQTESVPPLIDALRNGDLVGSESPAWALAAIGSPMALEDLNDRISSPYASERRALATALGQIGSEDSIPWLQTLLDDRDFLVKSRAVTALSEIGTSSAALAILGELSDSPSEEGIETLLHMAPEVLLDACERFVKDGDITEQIEQRRELCGTIQERLDEPQVTFFSTGELHSVFYSAANAKARTVSPEKGRKAIGWEDFIGKENGGIRYKLKKGLQVTIWKAAFHHGETWLEVTESPYAANVWVREADLSRVDLSRLQDSYLYKNYGAESHFRITGAKEDTERD